MERFIIENFKTGKKQIFTSEEALKDYLNSISGNVFILDHQIRINNTFKSIIKADYQHK